MKVLLGLHGSKLPGEGNHLYPVNPIGLQEHLFLLQGAQDPEIPGILLQNRPGMGPECDNDGLLSPFAGRGDHGLQNMTVAQMDPIKESCSYYSHLTHSKLWRCGSRAFLAKTRAPTL